MTGKPIQVRIEDAALLREQAVLATLPERWRITDDRQAPVGLTTGWNRMGDSEASLVVIHDPMSLDEEQLESLSAASKGPRVVLQCELLPRLAADPLAAGASSKTWSMLDSVAHVPSARLLPSTLLEQISAARYLLGALDKFLVQTKTATQYVVSARGEGGSAVTLSAVVAEGPTHRIDVDMVSPLERIDIQFDLVATAHPMTLTRFDGAGATQSWPVHQSGHRLLWADIAASWGNDQEPHLVQLALDAQIAKRLLDTA